MLESATVPGGEETKPGSKPARQPASQRAGPVKPARPSPVRLCMPAYTRRTSALGTCLYCRGVLVVVPRSFLYCMCIIFGA